MKILQVIAYFYPAWSYGGPPRNTYGLCRELVKRSHQVTVFTTDTLDNHNRIKETRETVDGIEIRRFRNLSNYIAFNHRIFLSAWMPGALQKEIRNYDIIHLNDFRTLQNITAYNNASKNGVPYILQANGSLVNILAKQRLKSLFDNLYGRKILQHAARLLALAPIEAAQYKSYGISAEKIDIVPNGIELNDFKKLPPRGKFRQKYSLGAKEKMILYLGRLHKIKGIDLLINAFAGMTKDFNDTRLVIAGPDDGYLPELKKLTMELGLTETVLFPGALFSEDKLEAYVDADVYALTSSYEMSPTSVFEALACGTPVIVTNRCGIADIIKKKAGMVVPYEVKPLEAALRKMLEDEKQRRQWGRDGKAMVWKQYGYATIAGQIEKIYQKCLNKA